MAARTRLILWVEVVRPALYLVGWLTLGATAMWAGPRGLAQYPILLRGGIAILGGVIILTSFAGLWCYWGLLDGVRFVEHGYRIEQLPPREYWNWTLGPKAWVYEEWSDEDGIRQLPFVRDILSNGYPAATVVYLPGEGAWAVEAPEWARGRRAEIIARIAECAGKGTKFAESEPPNEPLQPTSGADPIS